MVKKMNKKTVISWAFICVFLSACVYLSFPKNQSELSDTQDKPTAEQPTDEFDLEEIVEAYFATRPVRDVPKEADFSSFLVGNFAKSQRNFEKTANAYTAVLEKDSQNLEIKEILYQYYVLAGLIEKAYPYAQMALEIKSEELLPRLTILSVDAKKQEFNKVFEFSEKFKDDKNAFLYPLLKAWALVGLNDKDGALKAVEDLKSDETLTAAYLLHKGMISDYFADTETAGKMYDELLGQNEAKNVRVLLLLKEFESRTHKLKNTKTFALQYATMQEESFVSKEMLSTPKDGGRVTSATQGISWVFFDMASAMSQLNDLDLALFFSRLALYLNPENTVIQLFVGEILEAMGLTEQANDFYRIVTPNQNIFLSVQMRTIMNLIKKGQTAKAIENLNALIKAFPNGALLHMTLGDAYREQEDYEKALSSYQNATRLADPSDKQVAVLFFYQGVCFEAMGKLDNAFEQFEKAIALDGENPLYLNYAGYILLELEKNIPYALTLIEKAVSLMPNDGAILDSLGWAYYMSGDYEKALPVLEKAVSLQAGNAVLNSHLGDVYWRLGRYREARFQWSHASTLKEASSEKLKSELIQKIQNGLKNIAKK